MPSVQIIHRAQRKFNISAILQLSTKEKKTKSIFFSQNDLLLKFIL